MQNIFVYRKRTIWFKRVYSALVAIKDVAKVGSQLCRAVNFSSICSKENWYGKPVNLVVPKGVRKNEFFVDEWLVCLKLYTKLFGVWTICTDTD